MYRIEYRNSPRQPFRFLGEKSASEWYALQDAVMTADKLQEVVCTVHVIDSSGKVAYDATNGEYRD
jgi:hypothetical protein